MFERIFDFFDDFRWKHAIAHEVVAWLPIILSAAVLFAPTK